MLRVPRARRRWLGSRTTLCNNACASWPLKNRPYGLGYPTLTAPVKSSHPKLLSDALDEDWPVFVLDRRALGYGRALPLPLRPD